MPSQQIPADEMAIYKRTARQRWLRQQAEREARREQGWALARQAADLLTERV